MADRKPLKVLPDGGGDSTGLGEFVAADTVGVVDGGTGLAAVGNNQLLTGHSSSTTGALTSQSNLTFDGTTLNVVGNAGVGIARTDGTLHVHTASAGSIAADTDADDLVVENSGDVGIQLISPDANYSRIWFNHPNSGSGSTAQIRYANSTQSMHFKAGSSEALNLTSGGKVGLGNSSPSTYSNSSGTSVVIGTSSATDGLSIITSTSGNARVCFGDGDGDPGEWQGIIQYANSTDAMSFYTANSSRMNIDSSGNVGIGTGSPSKLLHVDGATDTTDGTDPVARFERDGSSQTGIAVTSNGLDGLILRADSAGFGAIHSYEDLGFYTGVRSGSSYGNVAMRIETNGNVGIGTTSPSHKIDVTGTAGLSTGTAWTNTSDARIKKDVATITGATEKLKQLRPVSYKYTDQYLSVHDEIDGSKTYHSFVADEYANVFPDAVSVQGDLVKIIPAVNEVQAQDEVLYVDGDTDIPDGKSVGDVRTPAVEAVEGREAVRETLLTDLKQFTPHDLQMFLTAAIQELDARITALEAA